MSRNHRVTDIPARLNLSRSLNGTFLVTPVYLHRGAANFALGKSDSQAILLSIQGPNLSVGPRVHDSRLQERYNAHGPVSMTMWGVASS